MSLVPSAVCQVILATGVVTATACSPLYQTAGELIEGETVDGLPSVDTRLRWAPDEDLFVLGANAVLELGPGGGNLMGAMRGARIVSNELHDLMWQQPDDKKERREAEGRNARFANQYAAFSLLGEDSEAEGDESSSSEEEEEVVATNSAAMAAPKATPRPAAAKKATKAELALRKARKHRRATKGRRGMG